MDAVNGRREPIRGRFPVMHDSVLRRPTSFRGCEWAAVTHGTVRDEHCTNSAEHYSSRWPIVKDVLAGKQGYSALKSAKRFASIHLILSDSEGTVAPQSA